MAIHTGTAGKIYVNQVGSVIGEMRAWTLDVSGADLDTSAFGSGWKGGDTGIQEWSATCEGMFDAANFTQDALWTYFTSSVPLNYRFYVDDTNFFLGQAVIVGWNPTQSVDDRATLSISLKGASALTPPT